MKIIIDKILTCFLLFVILSMSITFCSDDISDKLIDYYNKYLKGFLEKDTTYQYYFFKQINKDQSNYSEFIKEMKTNIIPLYHQIIKKMGILHPVSEKLYKLNFDYVTIAKKRIQGYTVLLEAMEKDNIGLLISAFDLLDQVNISYKNWQIYLDDLANENKLTFEVKEG